MSSGTFKTISRNLRIPLDRRDAMRRLKQFHSEPRKIEQVASSAIKFGGHGHFKLQTQQKLSEITALASAVHAISPRVILEIGTARGGTLLIWASIASESVITCDLEDKSIQAEFLKSLPPPDSKCKVTLMRGDSHSAEFKQRVVESLAGRQADFLFIDGDHTTAGARADFDDYSPLVRSGGLVAFHDIIEKQPLPTNQVYPLWQEMKKRFEAREFIDDPLQCGYGIGLLTMP